MTAPDCLFLEQWPDEANRDDRVHYEPVGYGLDGAGNASTITPYVKQSQAAEPTPHTARLAFKGWSLETQRRFLDDLRSEHAYAAGAADAEFPFDYGTGAETTEWSNGRQHHAERKAEVDAGVRGSLPVTDSPGFVTWDFVDTDVGFDDEQLATRQRLRERLCAEPVVEVAALEGAFSGTDSEPYWYAIYLRDRAAENTMALSVGTIECASGRPTEQAIVAALSKWHPGPEFRVTKVVRNGRHEQPRGAT